MSRQYIIVIVSPFKRGGDTYYGPFPSKEKATTFLEDVLTSLIIFTNDVAKNLGYEEDVQAFVTTVRYKVEDYYTVDEDHINLKHVE